jgi:hypothetical protein
MAHVQTYTHARDTHPRQPDTAHVPPKPGHQIISALTPRVFSTVQPSSKVCDDFDVGMSHVQGPEGLLGCGLGLVRSRPLGLVGAWLCSPTPPSLRAILLLPDHIYPWAKAKCSAGAVIDYAISTTHPVHQWILAPVQHSTLGARESDSMVPGGGGWHMSHVQGAALQSMFSTH